MPATETVLQKFLVDLLLSALKSVKGKISQKKYNKLILEVTREILQQHPDFARAQAKLELIPKTGSHSVDAAFLKQKLNKMIAYEEDQERASKRSSKKFAKKKARKKKAM